MEVTDETLRFEQIVKMLHMHGWDAGLLASLLSQLQQHLPDAPLQTQLAWDAVVQRVWERIQIQLPQVESDIAFSLGTLAANSRCWRAALGYFRQSLLSHGPHHATHYNIAIAHWQLAQHEQAQCQLRNAWALRTDSLRYSRAHDELAAWRAKCQRLFGVEVLDGAATCMVRATPLGPRHAEALLHQQNDPAILAQVRLARMNDLSEARQWIEAHNQALGPQAWAIVHPEHGMVGLFALDIVGDSATFYYWIGAEFRGRGYGRGALRLLKRIAIRRGLRYLFSSVFPGNTSSLSVLHAAGFRRLNGIVERSEQVLPYYYVAIPAEPVGATPDSRLAALTRIVGTARLALAEEG